MSIRSIDAVFGRRYG